MLESCNEIQETHNRSGSVCGNRNTDFRSETLLSQENADVKEMAFRIYHIQEIQAQSKVHFEDWRGFPCICSAKQSSVNYPLISVNFHRPQHVLFVESMSLSYIFYLALFFHILALMSISIFHL